MTPPSRAARALLPPALVAVTGAAALAAVVARDPHVPGSWGTCPVLLVTGLPCPGCGGLRALDDVAHGQVLQALGSNALAVALLVVGVLAVLGWARARWRGRRWDLPDRLLTDRGVAVLVVVLAGFTVVRWLPLGQALAP